MRLYSGRLDCLLLTLLPLANAISIDLTSTNSIKTAAQTVAKELVSLYNGTKAGQPVGIYGQPYYWWESGAVWSGLIDYQSYTSDTQYSNTIQQALLAQIGPQQNYMPPNQTRTEGNDDQGFWALAAMTAAERNLPSSPSSPTWIDLARNVFDDQVARWDTSTCGGGLRWQIFTFNKGYDYKTAASQSTFFLLAARLARYTNNATYVDWANKAYDWTTKIGLITADYKVFDGALTAGGCDTITRLQWTYTAAAFMYGSAVMYNHTNDNQWQNRVQNFANAMSVFYPPSHPGIMTEIACESLETCLYDEWAFKALASQFIGATVQKAPFTADYWIPKLQASAKGAAQQCSGGTDGTTCGFKWTDHKYDGSSGVGQQLGAMNVLVANLMVEGGSPDLTATTTGGTQALESSQNGTSLNGTGAPPATSSLPPKVTGAASWMMPSPLVLELCAGLATLLYLL